MQMQILFFRDDSLFIVFSLFFFTMGLKLAVALKLTDGRIFLSERKTKETKGFFIESKNWKKGFYFNRMGVLSVEIIEKERRTLIRIVECGGGGD